MPVSMDVRGLDDIMGMLDALDDKRLMDAARRGLQRGLEDIQGAAKMLCPRDTGALKNSIKTRMRVEGDELVGEVYVGKKYGVFVEMGTGPKGEENHKGVNPEWEKKVTYSPKPWKRKLKDGREVFVYSDGMAARPFLYPAYKSQKQKVNEKIADAVIREAKKGG